MAESLATLARSGALRSSCFQSFSVCEILLKDQEDKHHLGAQMVFERLLQGHCIHGERGYGLLMEPDSRPIRAEWLTALSATVAYPNPALWVSGSIYRGSATNITIDGQPFFAGRHHINGNAIYRLSGDELTNEAGDDRIWAITARSDSSINFINRTESQAPRPLGGTWARFYFENVKAHAETTETHNSYDTFIFEYLMDSDRWWDTRHVMHKFRYTNSIVNMWKTEWSLSSTLADPRYLDTVIIHGGFPQN
jgi:hypothetical protein